MLLNNQDLNWFLIYTKPRHELQLSRKLAELGYEVYCPTYKTIKQWSDRKKKVEEPLFRSYVFIRIDSVEINKISWMPGFSHYVYWLGKPVNVREIEIESIRLFLNKVVHDTIHVSSLKVGSEVQIATGPLKKVKGKILRIGSKKATLQIDSLGSLIQAELAISEILG